MRTRSIATSIVIVSLVGLTASTAVRADDYAIDPVHSGVTFRIRHLGVTDVQGRFNDVSGTCSIDRKDAEKCSINATIKADSVDTTNQKRDEHLRSPDFFNTKQFPAMTFKSTSVKEAKGGYEVTGDLTLHGVTKPVTFTLKTGKTVEFPKGTPRTGFSADITIKRTDFG